MSDVRRHGTMVRSAGGPGPGPGPGPAQGRGWDAALAWQQRQRRAGLAAEAESLQRQPGEAHAREPLLQAGQPHNRANSATEAALPGHEGRTQWPGGRQASHECADESNAAPHRRRRPPPLQLPREGLHEGLQNAPARRRVQRAPPGPPAQRQAQPAPYGGPGPYGTPGSHGGPALPLAEGLRYAVPWQGPGGQVAQRAPARDARAQERQPPYNQPYHQPYGAPAPNPRQPYHPPGGHAAQPGPARDPYQQGYGGPLPVRAPQAQQGAQGNGHANGAANGHANGHVNGYGGGERPLRSRSSRRGRSGKGAEAGRGPAKAGAADGTVDEPEGGDAAADDCIICCEPLLLVAVGRCNHSNVCAKCCLRSRLCFGDTKCVAQNFMSPRHAAAACIPATAGLCVTSFSCSCLSFCDSSRLWQSGSRPCADCLLNATPAIC